MKKLIITLFAALALMGCANAPPPNTQPIFEAHLASFAAANPHTRRMLPRTDGRLLSVREFGMANKGKNPSLVMMHGFPDNQHLYDLLIPQFAREFHVVSFDFLGWGASEKPKDQRYDVASQRADLDAVVAQLELASVVPVLHDLSGQPGIDWALDNPAKTAALVLLNTYYLPMETLKAPDAIQFYSTPSPFRDLAIWGSNKAPDRFQGGLASQISKFFSNAQSRDTFVPIISHNATSIRPAFFSSTSVLWAELAAREKNRARMQAFKKPVHVVFGADDPFLNTGVAQDFQKLFSKSSLHLLANAGHYVQLDRADEVGRILREKLLAP
jgi:haloalkane dehalogenase